MRFRLLAHHADYRLARIIVMPAGVKAASSGRMRWPRRELCGTSTNCRPYYPPHACGFDYQYWRQAPKPRGPGTAGNPLRSGLAAAASAASAAISLAGVMIRAPRCGYRRDDAGTCPPVRGLPGWP
jgi:hypothetical protein